MLTKAGLQHLAKHLNSSSQIVMRADFNVPIDGGKITDANRIKGIFDPIQQLFLQFRNCLNIIQNPLSYYHILEDLMARKAKNSH